MVVWRPALSDTPRCLASHRSVPEELFHASLEILDLSYNQFTHFPDFPPQANSSVRHLDLSFNQIRSLRSSELMTLTSLLRLNLAGNRSAVS